MKPDSVAHLCTMIRCVTVLSYLVRKEKNSNEGIIIIIVIIIIIMIIIIIIIIIIIMIIIIVSQITAISCWKFWRRRRLQQAASAIQNLSQDPG